MLGLFSFIWSTLSQPFATAHSLRQRNEGEVKRLTWYLVDLMIVAILFNAIAMEIARHYHYLPMQLNTSEKMAFLRNTPMKHVLWNWAVPSIFIIIGYPFTRWVWFFVFRFQEHRLATLSAIAMSVAFSVAIFIPQVWLDAVSRSDGSNLHYLLSFVYVVVSTGITSYYYSLTLNISYLKSVLLNLAAIIMFGVGATIAIALITFVALRFATG
jgi:cation transport ATPase